MNVTLTAISPKGTAKSFIVKNPTTVIGRQDGCDLKIPLADISRRHTEIQIAGDKLYAKDLGSANGTLVNGQKISRQELKPGDVLTIGKTIRLFVQIDGTPANIDESKLRGVAAAPTPASPVSSVKPSAVPSEKSASVKPVTTKEEDDLADQLLGESFFMDLDEEEEEK